MKRRQEWVIGTMVAILLLAMAAVGSLGAMPREVQAAAITPVSITHPAQDTWLSVEPWNLATLAADTRSSCYETAKYSVADVIYLIDQTIGNTTTITIQYSNDLVTYIDGGAVVTANGADASGMVQLGTFGRYTCFYADVTDTNPFVLTLTALFK